jgi:hypothetical protein
MAATKI